MDVNTIFKDLATMVHEQGEFVDSIEANVESASIRVTEGAQQLRQAEQYKVRKLKYFLLIIARVENYFLSFNVFIFAEQGPKEEAHFGDHWHYHSYHPYFCYCLRIQVIWVVLEVSPFFSFSFHIIVSITLFSSYCVCKSFWY